MLRLKSNLLEYKDCKWYYHNKLFTGIAFFESDKFIIEPFYIIGGKKYELYHPICKGDLPSPIQINCTTFTKEESGCPETDYVPQLYLNETYKGVGYIFRNDVCIYEAYFNKFGHTESKIEWDIYGDLIFMQYYNMNLENYDKFINNEEYNYDIESYYQSYNDNCTFSFNSKGGFVAVNIVLDKISSLCLVNNPVESKDYLNLPLNIEKINLLFKNYPKLPFAEVLELDLRNFIDEDSMRLWANNESFVNTVSITLKNIHSLNDLSYFNSRKFFPKLKTIYVRKQDLDSGIKTSNLIAKWINQTTTDIEIVIQS